jgi:hypothetical protein
MNYREIKMQKNKVKDLIFIEVIKLTKQVTVRRNWFDFR